MPTLGGECLQHDIIVPKSFCKEHNYLFKAVSPHCIHMILRVTTFVNWIFRFLVFSSIGTNFVYSFSDYCLLQSFRQFSPLCFQQCLQESLKKHMEI